MLGLLVAGFGITGDAGWIVSRGQRLLDATSVPAMADLWPGSQGAAPTAAAVGEPAAQPTPAVQPAPVVVHVSPSLAAPADLPPDGGGLAVIDLRLLRPGNRVRLWVAGSAVAYDLVDPATGEAIQQPATRRVVIRGTSDPHRLDRGSMIVVQPRGGISGHEPPAQRIGPVQAIDVR